MSTAAPLQTDQAIQSLLQYLPSALNTSEPSSPEIYSLLAPILQQRLRLLASPASPEPWASLLTWTPTAGSQLVHHLSSVDLAAHPVSGEIEPGKIVLSGYRRMDAETLEAFVHLPDLGLEIIYHWVLEEKGGSWLVNDVHQLGGTTYVANCHSSVSAAEEAFARRSLDAPTRQAHENDISDESEEEDSYWAMYDTDNTQTPVANDCYAPTEDEYFSRFHDEVTADSQSTLDGPPEIYGAPIKSEEATRTSTIQSDFFSHSSASSDIIHHSPRPVYPETTSPAMDNFQQKADARQGSDNVAVRQHIGHTMKSLYRLARGIGMDAADFEDLIRRELALLPMMEEE